MIKICRSGQHAAKSLGIASAILLAGCVYIKGEKMKLPANAVLLDVRSAGEYNAGHIVNLGGKEEASCLLCPDEKN